MNLLLSNKTNLFSILFVAAFAIIIPSAIAASKYEGNRVALVIGNADYQNVPSLRNTGNDASVIAEKLNSLGFDVIKLIDATVDQERNAIAEFKDKFQTADIGFFFYAGHGIAINGSNYMIPVDARLSSAGAIGRELVQVDSVVGQAQRNKGTLLVFLDACRENPFLSRAQSIGVNGVSRGLAITEQIEKVSKKGLSRLESGNENLLVAFATQPGNIAIDGGRNERNSPFTKALAAHLTEKTEIRTVLTKVRASVAKITEFKQIPWEQNSLLSEIYLAGRPDYNGIGKMSINLLIAEAEKDISSRRYGVAYKKIKRAKLMAETSADREKVSTLESELRDILK